MNASPCSYTLVRTCEKCCTLKPLETGFYRDNSRTPSGYPARAHGRMYVCKECHKARWRRQQPQPCGMCGREGFVSICATCASLQERLNAMRRRADELYD
jgi:hypothetical protein